MGALAKIPLSAAVLACSGSWEDLHFSARGAYGGLLWVPAALVSEPPPSVRRLRTDRRNDFARP